jgi:hypothetical protein
MLPTMFLSVSRSMVYSSSRLFSRSATRFSSFSQLTMSLMPVFFFRPKSLFTASTSMGFSGLGVEVLVGAGAATAWLEVGVS